MFTESQKNNLKIIEASRIFDHLSSENRQFLAEHSVLKSFKRSQRLWRKNDPGEYCAFIIEGLVEIISENRSGEEDIVGLFGPSDIVGLSAIMRKINYPATAIVASKTGQVLKFYIRSVEAKLSGRNKENMLTWQKEMLLKHEQILRDKISVLSAGRLHLRLVELLQHLALRFSSDGAGRSLKRISIPIHISKTQIAKLVGARVETVIRTLRKWEKAGYFEITDKGISIISLEKLRDLDDL